MKKVVVKLDLHDDKAKQKALKKVSTLAGIDSIAMDMKDKKLTVVGDVDPVKVVSKLSKTWFTEIVSVGPAKEEKKDEGKKDEGKKDEGKKDGGKKDDKDKPSAELINDFKAFNPYMTQYYYVHNSSMEENPNACVIF